jgi:hypothetical protein
VGRRRSNASKGRRDRQAGELRPDHRHVYPPLKFQRDLGDRAIFVLGSANIPAADAVGSL